MTDSIPHLIGLYSPAPQSGKTTVANYLCGMGYRRLPFATPIKTMVRAFLRQLGYEPDQLDHFTEYGGKNEILPQVGVTPRHLMQTLGTEWGRQCIHPRVWINCWERIARDQLGAGIDVVVDDVRFANEAELILSLGGEIWRVERSGTERGPAHASEGGLDDFPVVHRRLVNDGTLLDLHTRVREIVAPLSLAC